MTRFAVLEQGESLARRLVARFGPAVDARQHPHLLIIAPGTRSAPEPGGLHCRTVLLPGDCGGLLDRIYAQSAVSYGLSGRDTITLSSRDEQRIWVALQRELVRLDGTVLERQEICVPIREGLDERQTLALAGAVLLLGGQPERL